MRFIKVYDLKEDFRQIQNVQRVTLQTADFGLKPDHGLFGSAEWWSAIEKGLMPLKVVEGRISRPQIGTSQDFPMFEMETSEGLQSWEKHGEDKHYKLGKKVRINYVIQEFKKPLGKQTHTNIIVTLEIEK